MDKSYHLMAKSSTCAIKTRLNPINAIQTPLTAPYQGLSNLRHPRFVPKLLLAVMLPL